MGRKRKSLKIMSVLSIILLLFLQLTCVVAAATEQIVQTQMSDLSSGPFYAFGQTFTPAKTGYISSIKLMLVTNVPDKSVYLEIHSLPIGAGSLQGTSAVTTVTAPDLAEFTFTFPTPVLVEAGTQYAFTARDDSMQGVIFAFSSLNPYAGGQFLDYDGANWLTTYTEFDLYFILEMTLETYTVQYTAGTGGSITGTATQIVDYGTDTTAVTAVPDPGYSFVEWDDGNTNATRNETGVMADATYAASFAPNSYTITFDSNGGSPVAPITQDFGTAITPPADPTLTGYTFTGWSPALPTTMPAGDLTVVAQWSINSYTITFDSNGGSPLTPITQPYNTPITPIPDPTRTGYTFTGWSPALPTTMPAADMTVVAQWSINSYTITFNSNGGSAMTPITQPYNTPITPIPDPTRAGYTFSGWSPALPTTMPAADMTVVAQWSINSYTITFDSNGGSAVAPITQDFGTAITPPANPTRTGYTFTGWSPALPETMPAADMTVVAQWTANSYIVTFYSWDDTVIDTQTVPYGGSAVPPEPPVRTGYSFAGWSVSYDNITDDTRVLAEYLPTTGETGQDQASQLGIALILSAGLLLVCRRRYPGHEMITDE